MDCLLPLEHTNIPHQGGSQALGFFLQPLLVSKHTSSKVEFWAKSSKLRSIFPHLGNHSLELVLSLIGMLMGFLFLGLEVHHLLLQPRHFSSKPPDLPLAMKE